MRFQASHGSSVGALSLMDGGHIPAGAGAEPSSAEEAEAMAAEAEASLAEYASNSGIAGIVGDIGQVGPSCHPIHHLYCKLLHSCMFYKRIEK